MRPGQNNKRMRGRPTNNRRGPNPLTRSYESNGPDVKIRGNAHHVAEKYLQLARDAHTSGDPVAAENYLQHAEHYFRLIASAQAAQLAASQGRPPGDDGVEKLHGLLVRAGIDDGEQRLTGGKRAIEAEVVGDDLFDDASGVAAEGQHVEEGAVLAVIE